MKYDIIGKGNNPKIAILIPSLNKEECIKYYLPHLEKLNQQIMICDLYIDKTKKKTSNNDIKEYLNELLPILIDESIEFLIVTQPEYFKVLTKQSKTDATIGDIFDSVGNLKVTYCPNYSRVFYDPDKIKNKIKLSLHSVLNFYNDNFETIGKSIIHHAEYPSTLDEIKLALDKLLSMECDLTCDIEGFSLKHYDAGIGTITFCWNQHEGIAFQVDNCQTKKENKEIRELLRNFFINFKHTMIYHNICYDVYVLIYQLFMIHILDQEGLLFGLKVLLRNWHCTQIITYLATNSCAGNDLSLKNNAQEFAGNYAQEDIHDITKIPLPELLQYNLTDGLSTWYVFNKHYPTMIKDQQNDIYTNLFKESVVDIIQMQLTGLPINMDKVIALNNLLNKESEQNVKKLKQTKTVKAFISILEQEALDKKNSKLKTKVVTRNDLGKTKDLTVDFNPSSSNQLQKLLYHKDFLDLPVLDTTDTGLPSTGADTLEKLLNQNISEDVKEFLNILLEYKASAIIISTFLPAFLKAKKGNDGWHYLFGYFRIGGTLSGRLSSNNPNLQNIPSSAGGPLKSRLAKLIKECFQAPPGWIFCGLDFDSLEDRISALKTKDPNKLKVYTDGYDGHSLRAYSYFGSQMPDIDPTSVDSINSIAKKYKPLRQESKAPTFALTYQGTYLTLMANCGFSKEKAQMIEAAYRQMYSVSIDYVEKALEQAAKDGYITVAFGLRVRTPILGQTIINTKRTPKEAAAEGRTAGNAIGQSYCMLNNRASKEFMKKVRKSKHRLNIKPCAHIHDSQYYLVKDNDIEALIFLNTELPKEVSWQDDPEIYHDKVKLSGSVEIYYPNWNHGFDIPNYASEKVIKEKIKDHINDLRQKGIT